MSRKSGTARVGLPIAVAVVAALAACSSGGESSCAYVVVLEDRYYQYVDAAGVQTGPAVGIGVTPGCDDGQPVPAATLSDPLVEVIGLDPSEAVARVDGDGQVALFVRSDLTGSLSPAIEAYLSSHRPSDPTG